MFCEEKCFQSSSRMDNCKTIIHMIIMNNDHPPTPKLRKWLMGNNESTLPALNMYLFCEIFISTLFSLMDLY